MKTNEVGRSMIEMLGVLAIIGVLSVGGIMGYSKAMNKYKIDTLLNQFATLTINIRTLFFQQNNMEGLSEEILLNAGVIPGTMIASSGSNKIILHILGGKIKIFPSQDGQGQLHAFELYAEGLTKSACLELATTDWGADPASGFIALYIGANVDGIDAPAMETTTSPAQSNPSLGIFATGASDYSLPLSPTEALSACTCSSNDCIVGMKYM